VSESVKTSADKRKSIRKKVKRIGSKELAVIIRYLEEWLRGVHRGLLTWSILEKQTGFSRQALSAKSEVSRMYERVKAKQRSRRKPKQLATIDERIARLQEKCDQLRATVDKYDDRWTRIAYHCATRNINIDELEMPLPVLNRDQPRVVRRPRRALRGGR
jgi:hypothetical protein